MLTRALFLATSWFVIALLATLWAGVRLKRNYLVYSTGWLLLVIVLGDAWALLTFGVPSEMAFLSVFAFIWSLFWIWKLRDWNAMGQVTWSMTLLATGLFILYSFDITAFSPLNPISFLIAITFYFIETLALLLALTHTYESLDVTCRVRWKRRASRIEPRPDYFPMVSLHLPTYNEPLDVVEKTLKSLAKLEYPNYEVLVVDNNTPDEGTWRPLEAICRDLGPNFHLLHLDQWPGYKSGALNFALAQSHPEAEIIGTIDADYQIDPKFLSELTPGFVNPEVAFIQTPQDYRQIESNPYSEATYYGYKYFFEVSMPSRNEHNAIIFAGTMGLIRRSVLEEIGGWDEWCITEDAEASLRILKRGYQSLYIHRTFGRGLMPFNFEGLKKQRFRWCFGGIQILKKHWEALMPWAHWIDPENQLTPAQRYYYLVGGLQWFTDLFNLLFAFFLLLGAFFSMVPTSLQIRPITNPIMVMPGLFLVLNLWRFVWVLRQRLNLSLGMALKTMFNFFSLGWAVTLASIQGIVQNQGVFLRTPKSKSGSRAWQALRATQWEAVIGALCIFGGLFAFWMNPSVRTFFLGSLLIWQASLYLAAPVYSLLSAKSDLAQKRLHPESGVAVLEHRAARWALGFAAVMLVAVGIYQLLPGPRHTPAYTRYQPPDVPPARLFGLERVPLKDRAATLTPTPTKAPTRNSGSHPPTFTATPTKSQTQAPTATPVTTSTLRISPTALPVTSSPPSPSTTPTPGGTPVISPTQNLTGTPGITPTPNPTGIPGITPTLNQTITTIPGGGSTPTLLPELTPTPTQPGTLSPQPTFTPTP